MLKPSELTDDERDILKCLADFEVDGQPGQAINNHDERPFLRLIEFGYITQTGAGASMVEYRLTDVGRLMVAKLN